MKSRLFASHSRAGQKGGSETPRIERLLALAADWQPDRDAPNDLVERALAKSARPQAASRKNGFAVGAWAAGAGTVGAAALACAAVGYVRLNVPLAATAAPPPPSSPAFAPELRPAATPAPLTESTAPTKPGPRPAALGTNAPHARPYRAAVASLDIWPRFRSLAPVRAQVPTSVILPPRRAIPVAAATSRRLLAPVPSAASAVASTSAAIPLDDDSRTVVLPVIVAAPEPDGSGDVQLIPAAMTLPAATAEELRGASGSPAPSPSAPTAEPAPIDLSE